MLVLLWMLTIADTAFSPVEVDSWFYELQCPFKDNYVPFYPESIFENWRRELSRQN